MRILILGGGGREHALVQAVAASPRAEQVFCAPGNAGTAGQAENVDLPLDDHAAVIAWAQENRIDLTVVGPEAPLCAGIVDRFEAAGLRAFGPSAAAARIEGDKAYAKQLMRTAKVPTPDGRIFKHFAEAKEFIATRDYGVVVKAAGLAAGKGVIVCEDPSEAIGAAERMMVDKAFGKAGATIVVEDLIKGEELSVFALVDGSTIYTLETAQDHKRVGEGDTGLNTGGMGAYSPAPIATPELLARIERDVLVPIVDALRRDDAPYRGLLYTGLMITPAGPKVLEFNCRFGDPEAQPLLARLRTDIVDLLEATVEGRLDEMSIEWDPRPAVCVVLASQGYPGSYERWKEITGLQAAAAVEDVSIHHAGTRIHAGAVVTDGGRVLGVTGLGDTIAAAQKRAYEAVDLIHFEGVFCRRDIGWQAIEKTNTTVD